MRKLLVDGHSCIIYKKIDAAVLGKEGFVSTHAITMVLRGMLRVENSDGFFEEIPAGKLLLLPKGLYTVSDILPENGSFEAMMFFFETEVIRQFLDSFGFKSESSDAAAHAVLDVAENVRFFADSLLQLYVQTAGSRQLTKMKIFELLHFLHASFSDKNTFTSVLSNLDNRERRNLRDFMEANFHKSLGIEDYAYLTGRSVSTFTRDFKAKFEGVPPKQWLIERRLEKAYDLLARNHVNNISEAAWESGYENVPHFIKEFHKRFGTTPKQFLIENRMQNSF